MRIVVIKSLTVTVSWFFCFNEGGGDGGTFWNWFAPGQSFSWTQLILPRFMRLALNDLSCEIFYIFGIFILFKAGSKLSLMLNT